MQKIKFIKMHGLGNDFVIIDRRKNKLKITKNIINKISNRRTGAGCDQVITIDKSYSNKYDAKIKIFNQNGDIAEACGNGTRCVAKLLFKEKNKKNIKLQSLIGILKVKKINSKSISVNLGKISHKWNDIPLSRKMNTLSIPIKSKKLSSGVAVNIGNPHIVFFGNKIDSFNLKKFGPKIENHKFFPKKTNVEIVEVINKKVLKMRVWERGAGITLACGSGACASAYASMLKGFTGKNVKVKLPKGSLTIEINHNEAIMTGPAEEVYKGYIELN